MKGMKVEVDKILSGTASVEDIFEFFDFTGDECYKLMELIFSKYPSIINDFRINYS